MEAQNNSDVELDYAGVGVKRSKLAQCSLWLGVAGAVTSVVFVGIFPGIAAIVTGVLASHGISKRPEVYFGLGYAKAGIWLGVASCVIPMGIMVLMPSLGCSRCLSNRSFCVANLRGIAQSMNVYAADNMDAFPVVPFAGYGPVNSEPSTTTVMGTEKDASNYLQGKGGRENGSVLAGAWIMVLSSYTAPKEFLCKSDPFVKSPGVLQESTGEFHVNFQATDQLSYSFAYPYKPSGEVGAWWKATEESSLPVASDMAPLNGSGKPKRNLSPGSAPKDPKTWSSGNHGGEGENVAFADGHAEWARSPAVGQGGDNIFTLSGTAGVETYGGKQPGKGPIEILTNSAPYDVVMVPARDLDRGGF